jgi:hypothetical protein
MPADGLTSLLLLLGIFGTAIFVIRVILMFTGAAVEGLDGDVAIDADAGALDGMEAMDAMDTMDPTHAADMSDLGADMPRVSHPDVTDATGDAQGSTRAFHILNLQTISAFVMGTGWFGLAVLHGALGFDASGGIALLLGAGFGVFLAWLQIWVLQKLLFLQSSGAQFNPREAIDHVGKVYMRIPEANTGVGKVRLPVSGSMRILPAASQGDAIESFTSVRVVGVQGDGTLVVQPAES